MYSILSNHRGNKCFRGFIQVPDSFNGRLQHQRVINSSMNHTMNRSISNVHRAFIGKDWEILGDDLTDPEFDNRDSCRIAMSLVCDNR